MADVFERPTEAGLWLQLYQDGMIVIGAHLMPQDRNQPGHLTIMWCGRPSQRSIASFCTKVSEQLDVHGEGQMSFLGREFRKGKENKYTGKAWLDAGANPGAKLLRFECSATPNPVYGVPRPTETVIVWATLDHRAMQPTSEVEEEPDEDENIGVNLQLPRLQTLEKELSLLIAKSHQQQVGIGVVQDALRSLVEYLLPRPQAKVAAA